MHGLFKIKDGATCKKIGQLPSTIIHHFQSPQSVFLSSHSCPCHEGHRYSKLLFSCWHLYITADLFNTFPLSLVKRITSSRQVCLHCSIKAPQRCVQQLRHLENVCTLALTDFLHSIPACQISKLPYFLSFPFI